MGVDIETWVETVLAHPLKYRFDGLDGWHTDVREAAVSDERFMNRYIGEEAEYAEKTFLEEYPEPYVDYLINKVDLRTCEEDLLALCRNPSYTLVEVETLEAAVGEWRGEFVYDYVEPEVCWENIREDDPTYLLKEHPPVEVWNEAYGCGFPIENVAYICPSCGAHAMTIDELCDNGGRHYCSLCGSEWLESHCFTENPRQLFEFAWDMERELWPFTGIGLNTKVWWEDPDKSSLRDDLSGWKTVTAVDLEACTAVLDHGTEAPFNEIMPEWVWNKLTGVK